MKVTFILSQCPYCGLEIGLDLQPPKLTFPGRDGEPCPHVACVDGRVTIWEMQPDGSEIPNPQPFSWRHRALEEADDGRQWDYLADLWYGEVPQLRCPHYIAAVDLEQSKEAPATEASRTTEELETEKADIEAHTLFAPDIPALVAALRPT
jgi:hypothetical protein